MEGCPCSGLFALFEVRNALVHPRRSGAKSIGAYSHNVTEQDKELVGPKAAASYIVAVAELTAQLEPYRPGAVNHGPQPSSKDRAVLDAHRKMLGDEIWLCLTRGCGARAAAHPDTAPRRQARTMVFRRGSIQPGIAGRG